MEDIDKIIEELNHIQGLTSLQCLTFPAERIKFHKTIEDAIELIKKQADVIGDNTREGR